jgi:hypothetical protein
MKIHAVAALLSLCAVVHAQDTRGRVQGVVTDSSQAVVAGAKVTLSNDNTAVSNTVETNQVGQYIFDYVNPGNYTLSVEMQGFRKFVQKNILVQSRGDVSVNAALEIGSVGEQVTVEAAPVAVQFNTSTMALTIDQKMANSLPIIHRNPFLLVSLNPAVVIRSNVEQSPFHHWAASQFDVGGNTNTKNDIILDGAPSMTTQKSSYTPPMEAVSEVNLQQNSVDAEFGHSAGGILSVAMKSGTNQWHGTAYYLGRNPRLNAVANPLNRAPNLTRQHTWGLSAGNPVFKQKLFNFFAYEGWRTKEPNNINYTMPTAAERQGDFSQSLNGNRGRRMIYDPFTTRLNADGSVFRMPFADNRIPTSRFDPVSVKVLPDIWQPNNAGDDFTGVNNFRVGYAVNYRYWNFSDRVDWNISDKWKSFVRYSQFKTYVDQDDYTGSRAQPVTGSERHAINIAGDTVWTISPTTVFNIRAGYNGIVDSFAVESAKLKESDLSAFWPSGWFKPYLGELPAIYYPGINVNAYSPSTFGRANFWFQEPNAYNVQSKISKNHGKHYFKVGGEFRKDRVAASRPRWMNYNFNAALTADTFNAPNTRVNGDAWAAFLLGALDGSSQISSIPIQRPNVSFWGFYFQDDYKISQRLTLNLGLRYEFQSAMTDPEDRLSRFLDLTSPIPEFQGANAPQLPAEARALRQRNPIYNGAWIFAGDGSRNSWSAQKFLLLPRVGLAYRVNNKTSLRLGYARYAVPSDLQDGLNILGSVPYPGFDATTTTIAPLTGVPQQRFADPFPSGLVEVVGKRLGRYTNLGGPTTWYFQDFATGINDRFNISLQRELPWKFVSDLTYFMNRGRSSPYAWDLNQVDPRIGYQQQTAIQRAVNNPFFNVLPADKFPGQLRTQRTIAVSELLRPYPQYGALNETLRPGIHNRYQAIQLQFQRPFVSGFNMVIGYNYNRERNEEFFDEVDRFDQRFTFQPASNARHRITGGGIWQLPFGRSRKWMSSAPKVVDWTLGGWSLSGIFTHNTGLFLRFGPMLVNGDPKIDNPTRERWFNTSVFTRQPAFTRRSNPLQFDNLVGPAFRNLDLTLAKQFNITEEKSFELRMEGYNFTNSFMSANPVLDVNAPTFGRVTSQLAGRFGRQLQYELKFRW